MAVSAVVGVSERVLLVHQPTADLDALVPSLGEQGLAITPVPLSEEIAWPHAAFDAALLDIAEFNAPVAAAAQRLKRARVRVPLMLRAPLSVAQLEDVLATGFDVWLPAETPVGGVAAQVRAICRLLAGESRRLEPATLTVRGVTIDFQRREVSTRGQAIPLTPTEFRIMARLGAQPGRVVSHSELFREVHGYDTTNHEAKDTLKVHMSRLRNKLVASGTDDDLIVTVRGFGYLLERRAPGARPQNTVEE